MNRILSSKILFIVAIASYGIEFGVLGKESGTIADAFGTLGLFCLIFGVVAFVRERIKKGKKN